MGDEVGRQRRKSNWNKSGGQLIIMDQYLSANTDMMYMDKSYEHLGKADAQNIESLCTMTVLRLCESNFSSKIRKVFFFF